MGVEFPVEIFEQIVWYCQDPRTLGVLRLVSRLFLTLSQPIYFTPSHPLLLSPKTFPEFIKIIRSPLCTILHPFAIRFEALHKFSQARAQFPNLMRIIRESGCTASYLDFAVSELQSGPPVKLFYYNPDDERLFLIAQTFPAATKLRLRRGPLERDMFSRLIDKRVFTSAFPHLQYLEIHGHSCEISVPDRKPYRDIYRSSRFGAYEDKRYLPSSLKAVRISGALDHQTLRDLFYPMQPSTMKLIDLDAEIYEQEQVDVFHGLFAVIGETLSNLTICMRRPGVIWNLSSLQNIRRLTIGYEEAETTSLDLMPLSSTLSSLSSCISSLKPLSYRHNTRQERTIAVRNRQLSRGAAGASSLTWNEFDDILSGAGSVATALVIYVDEKPPSLVQMVSSHFPRSIARHGPSLTFEVE